jgi:hypothetical protein
LRTKRFSQKKDIKSRRRYHWYGQSLNPNSKWIRSYPPKIKIFPHEYHFLTELPLLSVRLRRCGRLMPCEPLTVPMAISLVMSGITMANLKCGDIQKKARRERKAWSISIYSIQDFLLIPVRECALEARMKMRRT